jgi:outer membrane protein TolC
MHTRLSLRLWPIAVGAALLTLLTPAQSVRGQVSRPITLAEALTLAAQHSHVLRAAAFEVTIAKAQLAQAEASGRGTLTLNASYTRVNERAGSTIEIPPIPGISPTPITITLPPPDPNVYSAGLTYQIPLYTGGRNEAQIALARANLRGAEAALERAKQQVIFEVRAAYYQVLLAQAGIEAAQRMLTAAEENLRVARARVAAGASPRFDEIQAEVNLANARASLIRARNAQGLAMQGLSAVLAQPLDSLWTPRETMSVVVIRSDLAGLVRRALEGRPELAEVQARIAAARAAIDLVRSGTRPVVVLSGGPSYGNVAGAGGSAAATTGWSVTLAATLAVFDGNLTAERIREAEARLEQLKVTEAQVRQGIELDVRRAWLNHASAAEELATADKTIEQAREGLRIANVRFAAGVSTNLEVVQAQAALAQAEANKIQALFNVNLARAQLERAVGGTVE